jgi:hypothetical protein
MLLPLAIVSLLFTQAATPKPMEFKDAQLQTQEGDKTRQTDCTLRYEDVQLVIVIDKKKPEKNVTLKYEDITSGDYTFGKSPRVAAALLVSPLFLFSSSKSHWLTVKTKDEFALLRLDKGNYKLAIAELEKRAHVTVAAIGEAK